MLSLNVDITLNGYVRNEHGACFRGFAGGDISLDIVIRKERDTVFKVIDAKF